MDKNYWNKRWENREIAFHESSANPFLTENFSMLGLDENSRVLIPLCGKTLDIAWFLNEGHQVVGVELIQSAIEELFDELGIEPVITNIKGMLLYEANNLQIYVGDFFSVTREMIGNVDAVYDRAALIALPPDLQSRYAAHLVEVSNSAPQLLVTMEYDQELMDGPPFSISSSDVKDYYQDHFEIIPILDAEKDTLFKAMPVKESVWILRKQ